MKHYNSKIKIITTADGSKTIYFPKWNESYHSQHGAIQEAKHVYIQAGLDFRYKKWKDKTLNILEIGFGTGLNAFLSSIYAKQNQVKLNYYGIEKYPLSSEIIDEIDYAEVIKTDGKSFAKLHDTEWAKSTEIHDLFKLKKIKTDFRNYESQHCFDIIFFDAFGPRVQPDLWERPVLQKCSDMMTKKAVWVTYSCKGSVRRDLLDLGFKVEKILGPPGKREMMRAIKQ